MARSEIGTVTKRSGGRRKVRWDSKTGEVWVEADGLMGGWKKLSATANTAAVALQLADQEVG